MIKVGSKIFNLGRSKRLSTKQIAEFLNQLHAFIISNTTLKLAKNQANAKQYLEAEILLFENYSHSSSMYHVKIIGFILKK